MTRLRAILVSCALAACSHGEIPGVPDPAVNPLMPAGPAVQLTFDAEGDWVPVWLPDSTRIAFTWRVPGRADRDRCLAFMPVALRQIDGLLCAGGHDERDSLNSVFSAAFSPGGQVAFLEAQGGLQSLPSYRFITVGRVDGVGGFRHVAQLPLLSSSGALHNGVSHLAWVGESTLVYVALRISYVTGVPEPVDTIETPIEIVRLDLAGDTAVVSVVPGTTGNGVVAVDQATRIAYTLAGDDIFELNLLTGQQSPRLSLGAIGPVRDIHVTGGRVVATIRGASSHGSGDLAVVDLAVGVPTIITTRDTTLLGGYLYARPSISPSLDRVVAEAFAYTVVRISGTPFRDTLVSHNSDLFLFTVP